MNPLESLDPELAAFYQSSRKPPSLSMCASMTDYYRALYQYREAEAHALSEALIRAYSKLRVTDANPTHPRDARPAEGTPVSSGPDEKETGA